MPIRANMLSVLVLAQVCLQTQNNQGMQVQGVPCPWLSSCGPVHGHCWTSAISSILKPV